MIHENVFAKFPTSTEHYSTDVAPIINYVTSRYGKEEWRAVVLTNELHGHLGIYSTIGVKMGIYACEQLGKTHHIKVISCAGTTPPISCMNDGLQVSTQATLGHGLITVAECTSAQPEAIFMCDGRRLHLRLKSHVAIQIERDIRRGVEMYGTASPQYWAYVRHLAIDYWQSMDRNEIFETILDQ